MSHTQTPGTVPCPCAVCGGTLFYKPRTVREHMRKNPQTLAPVQSFVQWQASASGSVTAAASTREDEMNPPGTSTRPPSSMSIDTQPDIGQRDLRARTPSPVYNNPLAIPFDQLASNSPPPMQLDDPEPDRHFQAEDPEPESPPGAVPIPNPPTPLIDHAPFLEDEAELGAPPILSPEDEVQEELERNAAIQNIANAAAVALPDPFAPPNDEDEVFVTSTVNDIAISQKFINDIKNATLENDKLSPEVLAQLREPNKHAADTSELDDLFHIELYFSTQNAPESVYNHARAAIQRRFEADNLEVPSLYQIRKRIADITGVVDVQDDMCNNSCLAFTGPFSTDTHCSLCGESHSHYNEEALEKTGKKVPRKQMTTIPLGPQIQALRRSPEGAGAMRYRDTKVKEVLTHFQEMRRQGTREEAVYDDIFCGSDYRALHRRLKLTEDDTVVGFSLDGAQLYQNAKSDTWIGIWIIEDYDPTTRFKRKHVLPAFIVPGPNKPKHLDSLIYRSFHHLSAIQHENQGRGIACWDALKQAVVFSRVILLLNTADAPALAEVDGRVGHHGARGCRLGCLMKGRHKPSSGHYYAVHLRPQHYTIPDCDHDDVDIRNITRSTSDTYQDELETVVKSRNDAEYIRNRKETGISKPSLLSGLDTNLMLPVPTCFTVDLMHLFFLNFGELFIPLWRGTLKCESSDNLASWDWATLTGDVWTTHGSLVASSIKFFPSSFHRPPRNPAEKINSGFKATESGYC